MNSFLDMSIFFSDDEMRKQGETLAMHRVVTGQEAVNSSKQKMREDLYKKLMSADPIAVRLPYAIVTKMVELSGWARFELNSLMNFAGVHEASFDSIMRRSCVAEFKGQFVSAAKLRSLGGAERCKARGVFLRDPSLKTFLKSRAAAHAMLRLVHGFAKDNSLDECERIIEEYVDGKDGGLTRRTMRAACDLPETAPTSCLLYTSPSP